MYCTHCGREMPEGAEYCVFCAQEQGGEEPAGARDERREYVPGDMPKTQESYPGHSDTAAWLLSVMPVVATAALMILIPLSVPLAALVWLLTIGANAALYVMDKRQFPEQTMDGWGWLAIVLPTVYLYIRAYRIDRHYGPAILRTALIAACGMALSVWGVVEMVRAVARFVQQSGGFEFHF